ncbi:uncharacterized protein LOC103169698 isoform X2 [Ornithorhynchus anatinus]|uniref:uncharacterized protein LOC103169698 isoform X2 n=1 Tax=Ornithorhynchus anatinus TaxID=9258 RepID=UPI0010A825EB|nr:uncharacterized protein LOC103169698 isoform X2 [Ornithorhynchus anatinus]
MAGRSPPFSSTVLPPRDDPAVESSPPDLMECQSSEEGQAPIPPEIPVPSCSSDPRGRKRQATGPNPQEGQKRRWLGRDVEESAYPPDADPQKESWDLFDFVSQVAQSLGKDEPLSGPASSRYPVHAPAALVVGEEEGPAHEELERVIDELQVKDSSCWTLPDDVLDYLAGDSDAPGPGTRAPPASPSSPVCTPETLVAEEGEGAGWSGEAREELEQVICELRVKDTSCWTLPDDVLDYFAGDSDTPGPGTRTPPASPTSPVCAPEALAAEEGEGPTWSGETHEELERVILELRAKGPSSWALPDDMLDFITGDSDPPKQGAQAPPGSPKSPIIAHAAAAAGEGEGPAQSAVAHEELEQAVHELQGKDAPCWTLPDDVPDYLAEHSDPPSPVS